MSIWQRIWQGIESCREPAVVVLNTDDWNLAQASRPEDITGVRGVPIRGSNTLDSFIVDASGDDMHPAIRYL